MKTEGHILSCTDKIHDIGTDTGYYHRQRIYHIIILGFDTGKQHHHRHNLEEEGSDRDILVFFINIVQPLNTDRRKNDRR